MTETYSLRSTPGLGLKAGRFTTLALREISHRIDNVAITAAFAVAATSLFDFGPAFMQLGDTGLMVAIVALWGAAKLVGEMAADVADWIDPDATDGDTLWMAAELFKQLGFDVQNGADKDDVLAALQATRVLPALSSTLKDLQAAYQADGEQDEADDLSTAARQIQYAAEALGDKQF